MIQFIIRVWGRKDDRLAWLVQLVNGATAVMTANEILADMRTRR